MQIQPASGGNPSTPLQGVSSCVGHVQHAQNNRLLRPEVSRDTSGETGAGEGSDRHQAKVRHDSMATGDSLSAPATDCVKYLSDVYLTGKSHIQAHNRS